MEPADCAAFAGHGNAALNKGAGETIFFKLVGAKRARKKSAGIFVRLRFHYIGARQARFYKFHKFLTPPAPRR